MLTGIWTSFLLSFVVVAAIAWLVSFMHENGVRPMRDLVAFFRRQPMAGRILFGTFFVAMWVIAGTKPGGGAGRPALPEASSTGRDVLPESNSVGRDVPVALRL